MIAIPPALVYFAGALLLPLVPARFRFPAVLTTTVAGFAVTTGLAAGTTGGVLPFLPGAGLTLLAVDSLSYVVGFIFAAISIIAVIYARELSGLVQQAAILVQAGSAVGMVFAGDFISVFIFWEILALSSLVLIWQGGPDARGPGYRYALLHIFGGACLLAAIALQYAATGTFAVGLAEPGITTLLFVIGVGVNAAVVPLHAWLPDAYPRSTVVGSVVLCIFTTKAAIYLLARTLPGLELVMYLGAVMVVYGIVFAILQDDMRTLLSYHIVSQVGYMVATIGIGTELAINGGIAHLFNHILYKALLFMVAGVIIYRTGHHRLSELGGLWRTMPVTFGCSIIASAAIAGVPGFNGYVSKELIVGAAAESGFFVLETLLLIGSIGTFLSFVKFNYYAFVKERDPPASTDPPKSMQIAMVTAAAGCIMLGVFPGLLFALLPYPVTHDVFSISHILELLITFSGLILLLWVARNLSRPITYIPPDVMDGYRAAGRGITRFATVTLPAAAGFLGGSISRIVRTAGWASENPVLALEIGARTVLLRGLTAFGDSSRSENQREVIGTLKARYPSPRPGGMGAGFGMFLIAMILFVYFLSDVLR